MAIEGFRTFDQWKQAFSRIHSGIEQQAAIAVVEASLAARDAIQRRIPPGASGGLFPGYAAKGNLKRAIVASALRREGETYVSTVGLSRSAPKIEAIKAHIHEFGAVIVPRRAPYLRFQVKGKWVTTALVQIRAKHFMRDGWAEAQEQFARITFDRISRPLRQEY